MHKRTKKVLLGTAGLAVTLAPGVLAATQPILSQGILTVAAAEEVGDVTAKASLKKGTEETAYGFRVSADLNLKVNQRVKEGDTITLKGVGVNLGELNGKEVKTADGKTVGVFKLTKTNVLNISGKEETFSEDDVVFGVEDLNKIPDKFLNAPIDQPYTYEGTIVFNKEATGYQTMDLSVSLNNIRTANVVANKERKVKTSLSVGGKQVAELDINVPKADPWTNKGWLRNFSDLSSVKDTDLSSGRLIVDYLPPSGTSIKKGDRITWTLPSDFAARFKVGAWNITPGSEQVSKHGRSTETSTSRILPSGAFVNKSTPLRYKVVEFTPDKVTVETMSDYDEVFSLVLPVQITTDKYDKAKNRFDLGSFTETVSAGIDSGKPKTHKAVLVVEGSSLGGSGVKIQTKTTQWADVDNKESLKPSKIGEAFEQAGTVPGYTFVRSETSKDGAVTTHLFKKDAEKPEDEEIVTSFLEEGSGEKLKDPVKAEKEAEPGTIEGYQFVRTERKGNEVTHWFKKKEEPKKPETKQPNTRYVDEDGKVIEEVPGSQDKKEIPGYTYLRTEKDKDGNITHIYHKIVTRFVTDKGVTLKQMDGAQPKEDISGYEFVETKTDEKTGDVTHTYREVTPTAEPLTILKDDKGNVLKTTKGTHDPEDLPGYKFLRTEKDTDGNTVHIYHRIVTSFVTTKGGKEEVLKTKDGAQPKEEIDGYEFVETKTDEKNGDIKHFYKVKVVAGAEKKAPVQTAGNAGMMLLPAAAVLGLGGLVAGLARRKNN